MQELLERILSLESVGDVAGVVREIADADPADAVQLVPRLLLTHNFRGAYVVAKSLCGRGIGHPVLFLAVAIGGFVFGNEEDEIKGAHLLAAAVDQLTPVERDSFYRDILRQSLLKLLEHRDILSDQRRTMKILSLFKAGDPSLRDVFDCSADELTPSSGWPRRKPERTRLLHYALPPAGSPRPRRRAVVAIRRLMLPLDATSREFDLGPRICAGMTSYGWQPTFFKMNCLPIQDDYRAIVDACRQADAEILVLDDYWTFVPETHAARADMIRALRQHRPDLKVVAVHPDAWGIPAEILIKTSDVVDVIWQNDAPSLPVWDHQVFAGKLLHAPPPPGDDYPRSSCPLPERILFKGSMKMYNWHRLFWHAAATLHRLPIDWNISSQMDDNLDPMASYRIYMQMLADAGCCLDITMRPDHTRIVTARAFETINSGALLIEESTPDLDYFFVSGEHYLEFSSMTELAAVIEFLRTKPDEAEDIRRKGNSFARARYNNETLIGYLDRLLYFSHLASPA